MGWKQTVILGGAVLLLAACDRATAPIANVRDGNVGAKASTTIPTEPTNPLATPGPTVLPDECLDGISISSGSGDPICLEIQINY